jgi:tetratricopeptide (TPR) repeat protein
MIVKNESKVILRMLESVVSIIDTYCICDTGSTDDTIELISNFFESKLISGKIISHPFVNFEINRNIALEACHGMSDFVLLMDADMVLNIRDFTKLDLVLDNHIYSILQGHETFYYSNMRIIKNDNKSRYVGCTHEYINCPPGQNHIILDKSKLFITDYGDGGSKADKSERDIRLLTEDLSKNVDNPRSLFYLANTYFDLSRLDEAIPFYLKRIEVGGWIQEIWYSYYRLGEIYKRKGEIQQAVMYWMEGFSVLPERLENIFKIINTYRVDGKQKTAFTYIRLIIDTLSKHKENTSIRNEYLFMENDVYTHLIDNEIVILSYYNNITDIHIPAISVLNSTDNPSIIQSVLSNMRFYNHNFYKPTLTRNYTSSLFHNIEIENSQYLFKFKSSTPCIIKNPHSNGYIMNIRYHNYNITDNGYEISLPEIFNHNPKPVVTQNQVCYLDDNFDITSSHIQKISLPSSKRLIGVEDVRLFYSNDLDKILYIGTGTHDVNDVNIIMGTFSNNSFENETKLTQKFKQTFCEKNWVFIPFKGKTRVLYNWDPLTICDVSQEGDMVVVFQQNMTKMFKCIRGSTCGVMNGLNELWFICHVVAENDPLTRHYYDIFVVLDPNTLQVIKTSPFFKYNKDRIQYTLGLIIEEDKVIISYSTMDDNSCVSVYNKSDIEKSMINYQFC